MTKIKQFQAGQHLNELLLVKNITKGITNSGSQYLTLQLHDDSGKIDAKMWDVKNETADMIEIGKVYNFEFEVLNYRQQLQLKILQFTPIIQSEINLEDFVIKSQTSKSEMRSFVNETVINIENTIIRHLVTEMLKHYEEDFYVYPAATKNHHNVMGGLAYHTCSMIKLANVLCSLYPILNKDLLVAGVLLHDIGKVEELSGNLINEYTTKGKLLGHISICAAKLFEIAQKLGYGESEELMLLRHLVLSHHGQLEYGSPVRPQIIEAEILTYIDNIDARLNYIETAFENIGDNEFTSRLFALENRAFYKHKINKE